MKRNVVYIRTCTFIFTCVQPPEYVSTHRHTQMFLHRVLGSFIRIPLAFLSGLGLREETKVMYLPVFVCSVLAEILRRTC